MQNVVTESHDPEGELNLQQRGWTPEKSKGQKRSEVGWQKNAFFLKKNSAI